MGIFALLKKSLTNQSVACYSYGRIEIVEVSFFISEFVYYCRGNRFKMSSTIILSTERYDNAVCSFMALFCLCTLSMHLSENKVYNAVRSKFKVLSRWTS
jgi:hypothetical protein